METAKGKIPDPTVEKMIRRTIVIYYVKTSEGHRFCKEGYETFCPEGTIAVEGFDVREKTPGFPVLYFLKGKKGIAVYDIVKTVSGPIQ